MFPSISQVTGQVLWNGSKNDDIENGGRDVEWTCQFISIIGSDREEASVQGECWNGLMCPPDARGMEGSTTSIQ